MHILSLIGKLFSISYSIVHFSDSWFVNSEFAVNLKHQYEIHITAIIIWNFSIVKI